MAKQHRMIEPFAEDQVRNGISFGYHLTVMILVLAMNFKILNPLV